MSKARLTKRSVASAICIDCQDEFLPKWDGQKICIDCYYLAKEYSRPCEKCEGGVIMPEEPDETLLCKKCLGAHIKANMRTCTKCKKPTIYPNAPSFVKICSGCERAERGTTEYVGACTIKGCKGTTDEPWKKVCAGCWRAGKRG